MIEHLLKEGKAKANTAEGRVINAAYQAMNAQIEAEGLKDPDAMVASLETARIIATAAILHTFQSNKAIMLDVGDKYADSVKDGLKEVYELAFSTRH